MSISMQSHNILLFLFYQKREFMSLKTYLSWYNYILPTFVGAILNLSGHGSFFYAYLPYVVPFMVQNFTKGLGHYRHRYRDKLLKFHEKRKDPVFMMDQDGKVISSVGFTHDFLKNHHIHNLKDLLGNKADFEKLYSDGDGREHEIYFEPTKQWYSISINKENPQECFVWLRNISLQKQREEGLAKIIEFHSNITTFIRDETDASDILKNLSKMILSLGYQGLFMIQKLADGRYSGRAYRRNEYSKLIISSEIILQSDANLPIFKSRTYGDIIWANRQDYPSVAAFEKDFPFDSRVKKFFKNPIENVIDYHSGDISIISFNKQGRIGKGDELIIKALLGSVNSLAKMIEKNQDNEHLFFASISGLCAAAEYSDEVTGQHVWRVNAYSRLLAHKLGLEMSMVKIIGKVAALHDIGKVAIPHLIKTDAVYNDNQRKEMQMHTIYGAGIIDKMIKQLDKKHRALDISRDIALHHHQYWNGEGYPALKNKQGIIEDASAQNIKHYQNLKPLAGEEIPIAALIVGLADSYDALRSKRQYKPAFSHKKTVEILTLDDRTGVSGLDRFGPVIWSAFLKCHEKFDKIFTSLYG
ncbi:MAG: hypothetical protein COW84_03720 [Gammaproteobacteria bacterium CG22_combo_CG10-13_8_21_14_all_40_8]|nr:MAG: hypothetical protein COW84_03720 [Gammaproteobacteria bacterium CG22_combo_CG10-13_8_21_14_all_40_8]